MRHRRQLEQSAHQKLLVLLNVGGHDHQHIVGLAGGGVAAHNVRCGLHRRLEFGHGFVRVLGQVDLGHHHQIEAHLLAVHLHGEAGDDPLCFHFLDAFPAGRGGQTHPLGDLLDGHARVFLQGFEDFKAIGVVHSPILFE